MDVGWPAGRRELPSMRKGELPHIEWGNCVTICAGPRRINFSITNDGNGLHTRTLLVGRRNVAPGKLFSDDARLEKVLTTLHGG